MTETQELTKEQLAEQFLLEMMKDDPVKCCAWMLVQLGREAVACNAETLTITQESDIQENRYQIKATIKLKKIKPSIKPNK